MTASTFFIPYQNVITNITSSNPAVVTTFGNHGYLNGLVVRLIVPPQSGMSGINNVSSEIVVIDGQNFSIDFDSSGLDPFIPPLLPLTLNPVLSQVLPIAEDALTLNSATDNAGNITPEL